MDVDVVTFYGPRKLLAAEFLEETSNRRYPGWANKAVYHGTRQAVYSVLVTRALDLATNIR